MMLDMIWWISSVRFALALSSLLSSDKLRFRGYTPLGIWLAPQYLEEICQAGLNGILRQHLKGFGVGEVDG